MPTIFREEDFSTIQLWYGFVLLVLAVLVGTVLVGNVYVITAAVCALLIKDGLPNFIMGVKTYLDKAPRAAPKEG